MNTEEKKDVFIIHNSKDKPFVRRLARGLVKHGISSWVDEAEIRDGESLIGKIAPAIENISLVIAVISKHSATSDWVKFELDLAMTKEINQRKVVVIPVIIDKSDIPFLLSPKKYAKFTDKGTFNQNVSTLAEAIKYHISNKSTTNNDPKYGESVLVRKNLTYKPFLIPISIIALCIVMILFIFVYSKTIEEMSSFNTLSNYLYIIFLCGIASQIIEIFRLLIFGILIRTNPNLAQDAGNIHITFLWSANYRKFIAIYWEFNLVKLAVFLEVMEGFFILSILYFAVKFVLAT